MTSVSPLRLLHEEVDFRAGILGNSLVTVRRGPPTASQLHAQLRIQHELLKQPDPLGGINVLLQPELMQELKVEPAVRALTEKALGLSGKHTGGIAMVLEAHGFFAAAVRAAISSAALFLRTAAPIKIFDNNPDAVAWLVPRITREGAPSQEELLSVVEALTAQLRKPTGK